MWRTFLEFVGVKCGKIQKKIFRQESQSQDWDMNSTSFGCKWGETPPSPQKTQIGCDRILEFWFLLPWKFWHRIKLATWISRLNFRAFFSYLYVSFMWHVMERNGYILWFVPPTSLVVRLQVAGLWLSWYEQKSKGPYAT